MEPPPNAAAQGAAPSWRGRAEALLWRAEGTWTAALVALVVYVNTLWGSFVHDDRLAIVEHGAVTGALPLRWVLSSDFWGYPCSRPDPVGTWRPLATLAFALEWRLGGGRAWVFHLVSVGLHALATALFHRVACLGLRDRRAALFAALLFAVHPLHTEAVAALVGQADLLLCSLWLVTWALHRRPGARASALGVLAFLASMLAKESAVLAVPFLVVHDLGGTSVPRRTRLARYAAYVAVIALVAAMRLRIFTSLQGYQVDWLANPLVDASPLARRLTGLRMFWHGLRLLVAPTGLIPDYGLSVVVPSTRLDARVILGFLGLAGLVALGAWSFRRRHLLTEAVAWLVIPTALSVNLVVLTSAAFAERLWYLPSSGACLLAGAALPPLLDGRRSRPLALAALGLWLAALATLTVRRNHDWRTEDALFEAAVRTDPRSALSQYNAGLASLERGRYAEALTRCRRASALAPRWGSPHGCAAVALERAGRSQEAVPEFMATLGHARTDEQWLLWFARFLAFHGQPRNARTLLARTGDARRWSPERARQAERFALVPATGARIEFPPRR